MSVVVQLSGISKVRRVCQQVSPKRNRRADKQNRRQVQGSGRNQGHEPAQHKQIQRNFKVALHRRGQWAISDCGLRGAIDG